MGLFNKNKKISGSITASLIDDANNESRQKLAKASAGKKGHKHNKKAEKKKRDNICVDKVVNFPTLFLVFVTS